MIDFVTEAVLFVVMVVEPGVLQVLHMEAMTLANCLSTAADLQALSNIEGAPVGAMCNPVIDPQVIANDQ